MVPLRALAAQALASFKHMPFKTDHLYARSVKAACEMLTRAGLNHHRPSFRIDSVTIDEHEYAISEQAALVAPFAALLRDTVRTLLPDHDVYITDWHNARDIELAQGRFGLHEYVEHIVRFLEFLGSSAHAIGVCQPCVAVLAATALMAQHKHPAQPRSMMAGPIDTRLNPTKLNELATSNPIEWFERNLIATVPAPGGASSRASCNSAPSCP